MTTLFAAVAPKLSVTTSQESKLKNRPKNIFFIEPPRGSVRRAIPLAAPPIVDATDDHVARVEGKWPARRRQRRARIAEHFDFIVRSDDLFRLRQIDPAVAASRTGDGGCFGRIK